MSNPNEAPYGHNGYTTACPPHYEQAPREWPYPANANTLSIVALPVTLQHAHPLTSRSRMCHVFIRACPSFVIVTMMHVACSIAPDTHHSFPWPTHSSSSSQSPPASSSSPSWLAICGPHAPTPVTYGSTIISFLVPSPMLPSAITTALSSSITLMSMAQRALTALPSMSARPEPSASMSQSSNVCCFCSITHSLLLPFYNHCLTLSAHPNTVLLGQGPITCTLCTKRGSLGYLNCEALMDKDNGSSLGL